MKLDQNGTTLLDLANQSEAIGYNGNPYTFELVSLGTIISRKIIVPNCTAQCKHSERTTEGS